MKVLELNDLAGILNSGGSKGIIQEALKLHGIQVTATMFSSQDFDKKCEAHCQERGWDPDTTLAIRAERITEKTDDEVDGLSDYLQAAGADYVVLFVKDMTLQKMADLLNQVIRMKAFL